MAKCITGMLISMLLLIPGSIAPHRHETKVIPYANGVKQVELTICGDTAIVRQDGTGHVPIKDRQMKVLIDKPE